MKNIFLFLLLIIVIITVSQKKEGLQNITQPIVMDVNDYLIYSMMDLISDTRDDVTRNNVINDLKYFNNATNIIYGYTRIPNV